MSEAPRCTIRRAVADDAGAIIAIVTRAARISNAPDYTPEQIEELVAAFSPERVASHIAERETFVAVGASGAVLGTAAYSEGSMRAVFVDPEHQGAGVGRVLLGAVEDAARRDGRRVLAVRASRTAVAFYARHGYVTVRELPEGVPRVLMEKAI